MPNSLLSTKLFIPLPRLNPVPRERLILRLNDGVRRGCALILVSASAGFGKTTLISAWLGQMAPDWPVAWVSLDDGDNDPALFVRYLAASMQKADSELGERLLPVLSAAQAPGQHLSLVELAALLINAVSQSGKKLLLVLDDYHLIHSAELHAFIHVLVEHQPKGMHVVLITREDPPLPLPRLRARGQVTEIRERDLRFTQLEAQAFFDQSMGLDLLPKWVAVLEEHTEGWVAGLQLAALAIQESPDPDSIEQFLQTFAGSDRYVIDYLLDEVYDRQPADIQDFLLRSSILERMCAPLCDQLLTVHSEPGLTGSSTALAGSSPALLQRLERGNLFLIPLDNQRTWFRYHHLFAELLRHRLLQEKGADFIRALHRAASTWFEAQGDILDAVRHAFQTGDWDFSVSLVERHAMSIVSRSQVSTFLEWYRQIPEPVLQERPLACIYIAWALVLIFREDYRPVVEAWLQRAEQALHSEHLPETAAIGAGAEPVNLRDYVTGQVAVIRSQNLLASFQDPVDPQHLIDLSQQAFEILPGIARVERSVCAINLALAHLSLSRTAEAEEALTKAYQLTLEAENYFGTVTTIWYRARLVFYQGQTGRAEAICREGLEQFRSIIANPDRDLPAIRSIYVAQAIYQLEHNRLEAAGRSLEQSLDRTGWASWVELWAYALQVRLEQFKGNPAGVLGWLDRMAKMGPQQAVCAQGLGALHALLTSPRDRAIVDQAQAWVLAHAPDLERFGVVTGLGPYHCDALYLKDITWARVQIALGEGQAALTFLDPVLAAARRAGLVYRVVELSILKAMALNTAALNTAALNTTSLNTTSLNAAEAPVDALITIEEALGLAEQYGFRRTFDQGPALDHLLAEAARVGEHAKYILELSDAFERPFLPAGGTAPGHKAAPARPPGLAEPLSERELEVLGLIATGCSNAEICSKLVIALGTVKRHINNIYGKLGAQNRTQAIHKARQLGLLP